MNSKDNNLIYEAYLTEKVTELTPEHLAEIRATFYPDANDPYWYEMVAPSLQHYIETGEIWLDMWQHEKDLDEDGLFKHLNKLKHGSLGAITHRAGDWVKNAAKNSYKKSLGAAKKELGRWKLQVPFKRMSK